MISRRDKRISSKAALLWSLGQVTYKALKEIVGVLSISAWSERILNAKYSTMDDFHVSTNTMYIVRDPTYLERREERCMQDSGSVADCIIGFHGIL